VPQAAVVAAIMALGLRARSAVSDNEVAGYYLPLSATLIHNAEVIPIKPEFLSLTSTSL
jgi:hypothetical protein